MNSKTISMKNFVLLFLLLNLLSCSDKKPSTIGDTPFQIKLNSDYKDASISPLKLKYLKNFEGLEFFPFNTEFLVTAQFQKIQNPKWFNMKTTTDRLSRERIYAVVTFKLKEKTYKLNIYQGEENMNSEEYRDYLFLPFLDNTNGETSYAGGRYIDLRIPEGNTIEIDFNSAYNPLCAYNEKYSCPIVPRVNYLDLNVEAGVKAFKK